MTTNVKPHPTPRVAKGVRRRQLIEATIASIAKRGLGETTLAHISATAGLSQGIVNLHFTSKDNLLNETLKYLRDEYEQTWQAALAKASDDPASQLAALLKADYKASVTDIKKLAVWFAFWGEVKSRPTYQKICQDRVKEYNRVLGDILERLIKEGNYTNIDAHDVTEGIMAMADGLWLNMLVSARDVKRRDAEKIMMQYMAQTFTDHKSYFL